MYPHAHPKGKEIEELKAQIEEKYKSIELHKEAARTYYKAAFEQFKLMGGEQVAADTEIKELVALLKSLQTIIEAPLI